MSTTTNPVRLDIGCGERPIEGFVAVDIKSGARAYPLEYEDNSVSEIRASHVLEHFSHTEIAAVVADWVRALQPGGRMRIAVPDFEAIARAYLDGQNIPVQGYVMGGHVDQFDRHGTIFDAEALTEVLQDAGLVGIGRWTSDAQDCAALNISLNLQGIKPPAAWPVVRAVMSVSRSVRLSSFLSGLSGSRTASPAGSPSSSQERSKAWAATRSSP